MYCIWHLSQRMPHRIPEILQWTGMKDQGLKRFHWGHTNQFGHVAAALTLLKPEDSFVIPVETT